MSLANTTQLERLEYRFEQMRLALQQALQTIAKLQSDLANQQLGQWPSSSTITTYEITAANAVVIAAGGSGTATVSVRTGSSLSTFGSGITIYNDMQSATVASKTIMLYPNSDGSFTVLTQSC